MSLATQITALATRIGQEVKLLMRKSNNLSDVSNRQTALNNLTDGANASAEHVLTKDGTTGNVIFKVAGSSSGSTLSVLVINANTTALKNTLYVLSASLTLTLPASPSVGDPVYISNLSGLTTCIVARGGNKIMGLSEDLTLDKLNAGIEMIYTGAANGWVII